MPAVVGQYIDQIMTTELRPIGNMPRGVAHLLYNATRSRTAAPLSTEMGQALLDRVGAGGRLLILCGAGGEPTLPTGEIDGLLGAIAIARAMTLGVGADVHIAAEARFSTPLAEIARAGGLNVRPRPDADWPASIAIHVSPEDDERGAEFSTQIMTALEPGAVLAIEKLSPNRRGVIHGATGNEWGAPHFDATEIFRLAERRGVLTLGIGDAGNEVGFGSVPEVRDIQPEGAVCRCPCRDGMAAAISADVVLAAAISDWGGYAVADMIAFLLKRSDLLVDADWVEDVLRAAVRSGVVCGWHARPALSDDGVPLDAQRAAATLMASAVTQALTASHSPSH
ncbi:hypothetical protein GCM10027515_05200 [Schumannella luteola]|uniref:D-glutamate cyclase-like C-terminal domain-containing protein n=1 Tax=Schumannella luteola TaxID=472059 RepID=A0A852YAN9_9MICO|nr:glutamate cyclase domain-containing protein [Schumannella luteola]NYG98344.1 hypothetical protein [Schumannella luteola]TPX05767.1 DUF4392 domain-containing protein [Schumannella luteola]